MQGVLDPLSYVYYKIWVRLMTNAWFCQQGYLWAFSVKKIFRVSQFVSSSKVTLESRRWHSNRPWIDNETRRTSRHGSVGETAQAKLDLLHCYGNSAIIEISFWYCCNSVEFGKHNSSKAALYCIMKFKYMGKTKTKWTLESVARGLLYL